MGLVHKTNQHLTPVHPVHRLHFGGLACYTLHNPEPRGHAKTTLRHTLMYKCMHSPEGNVTISSLLRTVSVSLFRIESSFRSARLMKRDSLCSTPFSMSFSCSRISIQCVVMSYINNTVVYIQW